jgi:flagellar hook-length control protein FliK
VRASASDSVEPKQKPEADSRARRRQEPRNDAPAAIAAFAGRQAPAAQPQAARPAGEPEKKGPEGTRRAEPSEPRVVVIDLRKAAAARPRENAPEPSEPASRGGRESDREVRGVNVALFRAEKGGAAQSEPVPREAVGRFREALQAELVRSSTLILREDGAGSEMRLVLKPESLGAVRIHLRMVENRIEGQIVVDNRSVRQLFESVLPALEQGLRDQGFGSASLEVSVGHRDSADRREEPPGFARAEAVGSMENGTRPADRPLALRLGVGLVDLVV